MTEKPPGQAEMHVNIGMKSRYVHIPYLNEVGIVTEIQSGSGIYSYILVDIVIDLAKKIMFHERGKARKTRDVCW